MSARQYRGQSLWFVGLAVSVCLTGCPKDPIINDDPDDGTGQDSVEVSNAGAIDAFEQAVIAFNANDLATAAAHLESAVDEDPNFARAWYNLGVVYEGLGRRDDALAAYQTSFDVDQTFVDGLANIGGLYLKEGSVSQAYEIFNRVIDIEQYHLVANLNLAAMHREDSRRGGGIDRGESDAAINRIRLALAGNANDPRLYELLAAVYADLERFTLARLVCQNAIEANVDSAELRNRLGLIFLAEGDVTSAYQNFARAVQMDENFVEASMNQGAIALNYRDFNGALESFNRVLANDSDNTDAMIGRAVSLRGLENFVEAEQAYLGVLSTEPGNLAAMYNLGVLFQEYLQDYERALEWFEEHRRADADGRSEQSEDVTARISVLRDLIELLRDTTTSGATSSLEALPELGVHRELLAFSH